MYEQHGGTGVRLAVLQLQHLLSNSKKTGLFFSSHLALSIPVIGSGITVTLTINI